jgi:glycosyltransferase involved in cell wall biosynthesis
MAAGIPVVATRSGGLPETVQHEVTGFLVERGDASGLAAALRRLLDNPELRRQMGEAGRRRVQTVFAWDTQIERLTELYEDLLRRDSVGRG